MSMFLRLFYILIPISITISITSTIEYVVTRSPWSLFLLHNEQIYVISRLQYLSLW